MKTSLIAASLICLFAGAFYAPAATPAEPPEPPEPLKKKADKPEGESDKVPAGEKLQIEVCFVLDTTGSMGGLIKGAKMKIWSIANEMATEKPTPDIRIGLIGYRDRKDAYVTKVYDLTDDLDAMYANLQKFEAGGGGDGPESVNQALHEAVTKIGWSKDRKVLKIVFLVGDAPPHMDYKEVQYPEICKQAIRKDLIINTIQCGKMPQTTPIWQQIARGAEGSFVQISQTGNMTAVATPVDKELNQLTVKLNKTVVSYGKEGYRRELKRKLSVGEAAAPSAGASRASVLSKSGKAVTGRGDLIADAKDGKVDLKNLKEEELPDELKKMSPKEREAYIKKKAEERKAIAAKIAELVKKRDEYLKTEMARRAKNGKGDSFDDEVGRIIHEQARRKR